MKFAFDAGKHTLTVNLVNEKGNKRLTKQISSNEERSNALAIQLAKRIEIAANQDITDSYHGPWKIVSHNWES